MQLLMDAGKLEVCREVPVSGRSALNESTLPKIIQHMVHERPAVTVPTEIGEHVQRRDMSDPCAVVVWISRRHHLAERDCLSVFLNEEHGPFGIGDPL